MEKNINKSFELYISHLQRQLVREIKKSKKVFIVPHIRMDYDALASSIALYELCNTLMIDAYIVSDDKEEEMKPNFGNMVKEIKKEYKFKNTNELGTLRSDDELVILTDVNSYNRIPIRNLDEFSRIVVIDHHQPDNNLIRTNKLFINTTASSASEMMYYLLKSLNMRVSPSLAQKLLSGIYLDVQCLIGVEDPHIFITISNLLEDGANWQEIQKLFIIPDFKQDRLYHEIVACLVDNTKFYGDSGLDEEILQYKIAICMNRIEPNTIYSNEQLADAVDDILKYDTNAAFVIGFTDRKELGEGHVDKIAIKARSKKINGSEEINVGEIMQQLNGGGHKNSAACEIEASNIFGVKELLKSLTIPGSTLDNGNVLKKTLF